MPGRDAGGIVEVDARLGRAPAPRPAPTSGTAIAGTRPAAASRIASTIFPYPVQRHRLPAIASRIAASVGAGPGAGIQERPPRHEHPRRADPALDAAGRQEGRLDRVELSVRRQPLHRADVAALDLADRDEAAVDDLAVDEDRARPALALAAAFLRPGQAQVQAQDVQEAAPARDRDLDGSPVDA